MKPPRLSVVALLSAGVIALPSSGTRSSNTDVIDIRLNEWVSHNADLQVYYVFASSPLLEAMTLKLSWV